MAKKKTPARCRSVATLAGNRLRCDKDVGHRGDHSHYNEEEIFVTVWKQQKRCKK